METTTLVTGGTGTLGRLVVPRLRDAGHTVRVLSRSSRKAAEGTELVTGDLDTGEGIGAAVDGAEVVVHLAGSAKGDEVKAENLVRAASRAGTVRHLVHISVVGADRVPVVSGVDRTMFGYFASKLGAERLVADSGLPLTILRATQFHDLVLKTVQGMAKLPVIPVPSGFRFQPVDTDEVAARLVELALASPAGLVPDLAGPRIHTMAELVRGYLRARGKRRLLVPVRLPGKAARAFRAGANLAPDRAVGRRTWEEFLAERLTPPNPGSPAGARASGTVGTTR
ncbi:MAG TPA: NAD(P)-binding oxidoreductase [Gaiellaceae bacterium]|nr:NAD(P)-binding oxidoreductase [Gaiellaceae bacterium]